VGIAGQPLGGERPMSAAALDNKVRIEEILCLLSDAVSRLTSFIISLL